MKIEHHVFMLDGENVFSWRLLKKYPGQHIALYQGKIVAHDKDVSRLEERVRELFGLLPVLIAPVRPQPARDLLWLGGRIDRVETT